MSQQNKVLRKKQGIPDMRLQKQEINRKVLHLIALCMPAIIFYLPRISGVSWVGPAVILALLLVGIIVMEAARFRFPAVQKIFQICFKHFLRKKEKTRTTGSTHIIAAAFICSVIFYKDPHIAFMTLTLFILGDGIAAIVGLSIGRIKIGEKTLEGSLACFLLCLILFFFVFPRVPFLLDAWGGFVPAPLIVITSFCITILELIPMKVTKKITINDNLAVPVLAGIIMKLCYPHM
jgi:dolichol kinase